MSLELGPIFRSLSRQKSASSLVLLELATGFVTISCLLLASRWYHGLATRPTGYDAADLIMVAIERSSLAADADSAARTAAWAEAHDLGRMRAVPEVAAIAPVSASTLDQRWNYPVELTAVAPGAMRPGARAVGWTVSTSPAIAEVLGLRLIEGAFPAEPAAQAWPDAAVEAHPPTVLTHCLRERLFGAAAPALGGVVSAADAPPARVVGVVEDVVLRDPWNAHGGCVSLRFDGVPDERQARYLVRARPGQRPAALVALRAALGGSGFDRRVEVAPFDRESAYPARLARGLVITLAVFGAIVALIALLGALTVSSFLVRERTRSIGIRRALGAQPGDIIRYFLVETSVLTAVGLATGLVFMGGVFLLMQPLYPGLYLGWKPLALTAVVLWLGALAGAIMAAQRAARIPPWSATRSV